MPITKQELAMVADLLEEIERASREAQALLMKAGYHTMPSPIGKANHFLMDHVGIGHPDFPELASLYSPPSKLADELRHLRQN
jgi:hypothetical protein